MSVYRGSCSQPTPGNYASRIVTCCPLVVCWAGVAAACPLEVDDADFVGAADDDVEDAGVDAAEDDVVDDEDDVDPPPLHAASAAPARATLAPKARKPRRVTLVDIPLSFFTDHNAKVGRRFAPADPPPHPERSSRLAGTDRNLSSPSARSARCPRRSSAGTRRKGSPGE